MITRAAARGARGHAHDEQGTQTVLSAIRAGASGYLLKDRAPTRYEPDPGGGGWRHGVRGDARRAVASYFSGFSGARPTRPEPFPELTARERDVLRLLAAGRTVERRHRRRFSTCRARRCATPSPASTPNCTQPATAGPRAIIKAREAGYRRD